MNKAALSMLLEQKVQEKISEGYSITTYALDAASRDRVKRSLKPQSHQIEHQDDASAKWHDFLSKVESGTYQPERDKPAIKATTAIQPETETVQAASSSVGQWKARRH